MNLCVLTGGGAELYLEWFVYAGRVAGFLHHMSEYLSYDKIRSAQRVGIVPYIYDRDQKCVRVYLCAMQQEQSKNDTLEHDHKMYIPVQMLVIFYYV